MLKAILMGVTAVLLATACRSGDDACARMRRLEPTLLASEQVDSCLAELRTIDTASLIRPADRARYALLHAMALDKNYIDTTDLSVIAPAADYYLRWYCPSRSKKFYTWYYKARIEENARLYDASLDSYLHAEQYMGATNDVYRTRLYFGMERVYASTISFKQAYIASKKALKYARRSDDRNNYSVALLDCACSSADLFKHEEATAYLREYEDKFGGGLKSTNEKYLRAKVVCYGLRKGALLDSSKFYLSEYVARGGLKKDVVTCIMNCVLRDDLEFGSDLMKESGLMNVNDSSFIAPFYFFRSRIRESLGDINGALADMRLGEGLMESSFSYNLYGEVAYTADKYHDRIIKTKLYAAIIIAVLLLFIMCLLYLLWRNKAKYEYDRLKKGYEDIENEYKSVYMIITDNKEIGKKSDDISKVKERLIRLSELGGGGCKDIVGASSRLVSILGVEDYSKSIAFLAAIYCRELYKRFKDSGLNTYEVSICTLVLLGCSTKEIEYILSRRNIRNVSVRIRSKLKMDKEAGYLDRIIKKIYSSGAICEAE